MTNFLSGLFLGISIGFIIVGLHWMAKDRDRGRNEGTPICDACGEKITENQVNVGHECDLHEKCSERGTP